jgi:uncharacterized membrane protein
LFIVLPYSAAIKQLKVKVLKEASFLQSLLVTLLQLAASRKQNKLTALSFAELVGRVNDLLEERKAERVCIAMIHLVTLMSV